MKKILLLMALVGFTFSNAQTTMSHSTDQTIAIGMVACADSAAGTSSANSYWRSYTPTSYGLSGTIDLTSVDFALSFTDTGATNPTMDIIVKLYTTDVAFPGGTLTEIASQTVPVTVADNLSLITATFDTPVQVNAASEIVVEVNMPDGGPSTIDMRIAGNDLGEDAPGYISAADCSISDPVTYNSIGFNDSHMIINLKEGQVASSLADNNIKGFELYPNPVKDILTLKATNTITAVSIYNMIGQEVISTSKTTINMNHLSAGAYIVKVQTANQIGVYNFIKL